MGESKQQHRKEMEQQFAERRKEELPPLCIHDSMKQMGSSAIMTPASLRKPTSAVRANCLCSPTTHVGSFRCRYHRNSNSSYLTRNSLSVSANLSGLGAKQTDPLHAQ